ncbi:lysophospholipid acyltransferase family protein [Scrofimicrobium sp. R131]|uniref:Lysophospholipid acyltransferase family protein n=1 Tax=Scrofimicrobium appendicitidis TaxID=3079930 RepID=A0AAU7V8Q1_9ACTO
MSQLAQIRKLGPLYQLAYALLTPILGPLTRPHWSGQAPQGGAILVSNHLSNLDPLVLAYAFGVRGHEVRYLAKAELFKVPVLGSILTRWGMVPVQRGSGHAADALDQAAIAVQSGQLISIFPEGTITQDPAFWPMKMKTGAARLALATGQPLVPVLLWGTQDVMDRKSPWLRLRRTDVYIHVLDPIDISDLPADPANHEVVTEVTGRIQSALRTAVSQLRGQDAPERIWDPKSDEHSEASVKKFSSWRRELARKNGRQDILPGRR